MHNGKHQCYINNPNRLHTPPTNYHLLAAQQEPYKKKYKKKIQKKKRKEEKKRKKEKKGLPLKKNTQNVFGEKSGEWTISRRKQWRM